LRLAGAATSALSPTSARLAGSLLFSLVRSPERTRVLLETRQAEGADQAVALLGSLRGGAMKLAQLASFVDVEFLPPAYRAVYQEKLAELGHGAPAMSWEQVQTLLEQEWGQPASALFSELEPDAVGVASIGQVHRGVLKDGRRVAVKVQYPEIADELETDLELASVVIGLGRAVAPGLDPRTVAGELRERVLEELDFELEAQHQRTFSRAYRGHPFISVPDVVTSLCRRHVLVSDWVDGKRFDEIIELDQEQRNRVGEILLRFFFGSMYRLARFNTDPHPGNYLLGEDGRMVFLDFGNTAGVGDRNLMRQALRAAVGGDADGFAGAADDLGYVRNARRIDRELLLAQALRIGDWYLQDRELRIDPEYVAGVIASLLHPEAREASLRLLRQLKVPPEEIWLRRVETSVLAVLGQLRATGNWHRIMLETLGSAPETELGRQDADFWTVRRRRAPTRRQAPSAP
jgi:predicted unusual protein kinase regulating ubiquinone biosynthesis (AarF/ABC1/UbiB family)